jgi:peptidoglycan hydrolase-like protein with peptidoglycan-binding domain
MGEKTMRTNISIVTILVSLASATALADDLTLMVEQDLAALGYDTGAVDGEETMETVIAISKFQAQNDIEVTGEVTPQLAGVLSAKNSGSNQLSDSLDVAQTPTASNEPIPEPNVGEATHTSKALTDEAALQAAQQACLEEKMRKQQAKNEKKRSLSNLLGAAGRIAARQGNYDIQQATAEAYDANATADDVGIIAKELGLSKKQVRACENPEM